MATYLEATTIAINIVTTLATRDALKPPTIGAFTIIAIHKGSWCFNGLNSYLVAKIVAYAIYLVGIKLSYKGL